VFENGYRELTAAHACSRDDVLLISVSFKTLVRCLKFNWGKNVAKESDLTEESGFLFNRDPEQQS
ncbi:MAG: hypothetical protein JSW61_01245, partial [Candidatus Thorarchaeota archaeon]